MNTSPKKLYRSKSDKVIAGVCGGLGEFFNIDPVLFRIVFVILALTGGSGILIYIIAMLVIPQENEGEGVDLSKDKVAQTFKDSAEHIKQGAEKMAEKVKENPSWLSQTRNIVALIIIGAGLLAFLHQIVPIPWFGTQIIGPLVIVLIGLLILFKK